MPVTAYVVGFINRKNLKIRGVGVLSEPEPADCHFPVVLFKVEAPSFDQARVQALKTLAVHPDYAWLKPVVGWKCGELGQAGETPDLLVRVDVLEEVVATLECEMDRVLGHLVLD